MKKFFAAVMAFSLVLTQVNPVSAKTISDEQRGLIEANCSSIKLQLNNVDKYGSRSRQHLGAQYESISTNLMMNLNLRLVKNNLADAKIAEQQTSFKNQRDAFKSSFTEYSKKLESLKNIDCKTDAQHFYDELRTVRDKRQEISDNMQRLREILTEHRETVVKLREGLK
jgi:hypothetical protein